jgi:hypothetical protein
MISAKINNKILDSNIVTEYLSMGNQIILCLNKLDEILEVAPVNKYKIHEQFELIRKKLFNYYIDNLIEIIEDDDIDWIALC